MKLGLLVVLAVAVLVPSLSEGRTVSKCELKKKLGEAITLPEKLQKYKEKILAIVICKFSTRSHLNTSLVRVVGRRLELNQTALEGGNVSQKDTTEMDGSLGEMLNEEDSESDEEELQQDDNRMDDEDEESHEGDEDEQELEEGGKRKKQSWGRWKPKRKTRPVVPWSLGYYGLFQLSDSRFCDSGYRWSRNECHTSCTAFTDDNIMDDIECFVKSGYWRNFLRGAPRRCVQNVFAKCE